MLYLMHMYTYIYEFIFTYIYNKHSLLLQLCYFLYYHIDNPNQLHIQNNFLVLLYHQESIEIHKMFYFHFLY